MKHTNGSSFLGWQQIFVIIACLCVFLGIGRIFSLVTNDPILGYANSYDMIRLQACHQIWPEDKIINITTGTPAAPLRRYTLGKHVDTPCFPSSELLFTGIGIEIAKLKNLITHETLISIKTIGFVKAVFLSITALLASLYFYRQRMYPALLANGLITALVLSDPGITLYLNTFYTEFSAVYFLYLSLLGVVVLMRADGALFNSWLLCIGLVGLGFSKPQHIGLALWMGAMLAAYLLIQKRWGVAMLMVLCAALPLCLQQSGIYTPRNASMVRVNNINLVSTLLGATITPTQVLAKMQLPATCEQLHGKNGYDPKIQANHICPEADNISRLTALTVMLQDTVLLQKLISGTLQQQKQWLVDAYGQVERGRFESVGHYRYTFGDTLRTLSPPTLLGLMLLGVLLPVLVLAAQKLRHSTLNGATLFLLLLAGLQLAIVGTAVMESGLVGLGKNLHAYWVLSLAGLIIATAFFLPINKLNHVVAQKPNKQ